MVITLRFDLRFRVNQASSKLLLMFCPFVNSVKRSKSTVLSISGIKRISTRTSK